MRRWSGQACKPECTLLPRGSSARATRTCAVTTQSGGFAGDFRLSSPTAMLSWTDPAGLGHEAANLDGGSTILATVIAMSGWGPEKFKVGCGELSLRAGLPRR